MYALSSLLLNIASDLIICSVQNNNIGIVICKITLDVLYFSDDLKLVRENKEFITQYTKTFKHESKKLIIGQEINEENTMHMNDIKY